MMHDTPDPQTRILEKLAVLEETLQAMAEVLNTIVGLLEQSTPRKSPEPDTAPVPIASYEAMYGPIAPAPEPEWMQPLPPRPGRLRRFFCKE